MAQLEQSTLSLSPADAKCILLAKAFEEHSPDSPSEAPLWSAADSEAASLRTAHALGEGATATRVLSARARNVLETLARIGVKTTVNTRVRLPQFFAIGLILLAFVCGAMTDRLAGADHMINLLSLPFWGVILWNIALYCVLFLSSLGLFGWGEKRFALPLRTALSNLVQKASLSTLKKTGPKARFFSSWAPLMLPAVRLHTARTLHLSAACFALGLIASLTLRGFATNYWAGWESTWLADDIPAVKAFLDWTYGLIPAFAGLPAMPDLATVAQMHAEELPYLKDPISAAPWLIRMMILMTAVVIIPRLILVVFDSWRISRIQRSVSLNISEPYYQNILAQCSEDAALGNLVIVSDVTRQSTSADTLSKFLHHWGEDSARCVTVDFQDEEAPFPALLNDSEATRDGALSTPKHVAVIWLDAAATPEEDVHGTLLERFKLATATSSAPLTCAAVVDLNRFCSRFQSYPERIEERRNAWLHLIEQHNVKAFTVTDKTDALLTALKTLRSYVAAHSTASKEPELSA